MLEIRDLRKKYGNFQALDGLSMTIEKGELFGFVGPNGAGKTTTIKIITGLLQPDSGSIVIDGMDGIRDRRHLKQKMGYVPDSFGVYDNLKVSEYMEFFASCYGIEGLESRKRCGLLLEQMKLEDKADFFVDGLSRGMKQRLCLARALIHDPELIVLDEPASGLDPRTRLEFTSILKELREQGKTALSGSMEQILERVNSSNPLLITIFKGREKAMSILRSHPCVQTISVKGEEIKVGFNGDKKDEALLLQQLVDAEVMVNGFMREKGSLETIFMQITDHMGEKAVLVHEDESGL